MPIRTMAVADGPSSNLANAARFRQTRRRHLTRDELAEIVEIFNVWTKGPSEDRLGETGVVGLDAWGQVGVWGPGFSFALKCARPHRLERPISVADVVEATVFFQKTDRDFRDWLEAA